MDVLDSGPIDGFVGFFDVQFCGSPANPADYEVTIALETSLYPLMSMTAAVTSLCDSCRLVM